MDLDELEQRADEAGWQHDPADRRRLLEYVLQLGASEQEILEAIAARSVGELAVDLALRRGPVRPFDEVAREGGLSADEAARFWRALGFPDPRQTATLVADSVAAGLQLLVTARTLLGEDATLALARVVGASTARIAHALLDVFRAEFEAPQLAAGRSYAAIVENYTELARDLLPKFEDVVGAVLTRHLVQAASSTWFADAEGAAAQQDLAVGFADLTGYTALSRSLTPRELAGMIAEFEQTVSEAASEHGGRVVKLMGDGALFSAEDARRACHIALDIVASAAKSDALPFVRVGLAAGEVVNLGGDVFGPVVNLAARLVTVAAEHDVVVDEQVVARVGGEFTFEPLPVQELKGISAPAVAFRLVAPR
jgi:adenylate cyclase